MYVITRTDEEGAYYIYDCTKCAIEETQEADVIFVKPLTDATFFVNEAEARTHKKLIEKDYPNSQFDVNLVDSAKLKTYASLDTVDKTKQRIKFKKCNGELISLVNFRKRDEKTTLVIETENHKIILSAKENTRYLSHNIKVAQEMSIQFINALYRKINETHYPIHLQEELEKFRNKVRKETGVTSRIHLECTQTPKQVAN